MELLPNMLYGKEIEYYEKISDFVLFIAFYVLPLTNVEVCFSMR